MLKVHISSYYDEKIGGFYAFVAMGGNPETDPRPICLREKGGKKFLFGAIFLFLLLLTFKNVFNYTFK